MDARKIMVVEDEKVLLDVIGKKLNSSGFDAKLYEDGVVAMSTLKSGEFLPDIIWLDYYLKDMEGLDFVKQMKEDPKLANIPVFIVSNSVSHDKVHHMLALGVDNYFLKAEHQLAEIVDSINQYLEGGKKNEETTNN